MNLNLNRIQIQGWLQYNDIDLEFHRNLTIITGPNGAGKSTVIGIVSRHFGYQRNLLATPRKKKG